VTAGIYAIVCKPTGHTYIGATKDLNVRRRSHWNYIRHGSHIHKTMAMLCKEHGPASMEWRVLEVVHGDGLDARLQEAETRWMFATRRGIGKLLVNALNNRYRVRSQSGKTTESLLAAFTAFCEARELIAKDVLYDLLTAYMKQYGSPGAEVRDLMPARKGKRGAK